MLGRLGMSVADCPKAYKEMAEKAFVPKGVPYFRLPGPPSGAFSATSLTVAIKKIVKVHSGDEHAVFPKKDCVKT